MIKKLTAIGNSYGLIIDKSILELLEITTDTELKLSTDGEKLLVEPVRPKRRIPRPALPPLAKLPRAPRMGFPKKQPW